MNSLCNIPCLLKRNFSNSILFFRNTHVGTHKNEIVWSDKSHIDCFSSKCGAKKACWSFSCFSNWNGKSEYSFVMKNVNTFSHLEFNLFNMSLLCRMLRFQICATTETDALENIFVYQEYFSASLHKLS